MMLTGTVQAQVIIAEVSSGAGVSFIENDKGQLTDSFKALKIGEPKKWGSVFEQGFYVPFHVKIGAGIANLQGGAEFAWDVLQQEVKISDNLSFKKNRVYKGGFVRANTGYGADELGFIATVGMGLIKEELLQKKRSNGNYNLVEKNKFWSFQVALGASIPLGYPIVLTAEVGTEYIHDSPFRKAARFYDYEAWRLNAKIGVAMILDLE